MTMLGEFVLPFGGTVWTSTIVDGLTASDVSERNVRQAVARLSKQGIIEVERHGRLARWHLTDQGSELLQHGAERIYSFGATTKAWDGSWFVVICSVPEMQRARRHQYRTQMAFEGFGFIAPGVAVSPHLNRENAANNILRSLNLDADATTFVATSGSLTVDDEVLSDAWNLAALTQRYQEFLNKFDGGTPASGRDAFAQSILMVDAWRRFPFIDPELPAELLPPDWIGARAHTMFAQHRIRWAQPAVGWYTETESSTTS
jgi:phenylacetic acid degradation operon negative regulatory protein